MLYSQKNPSALSMYCDTTFLLSYFAMIPAIEHTTNGRGLIFVIAIAMLMGYSKAYNRPIKGLCAVGNTLGLYGFYSLGTGHQHAWAFIGLSAALLLLCPVL